MFKPDKALRRIQILLLLLLIAWHPTFAKMPTDTLHLDRTTVERAFLGATDALVEHFWGASFSGSESDYYFYTLSHQADKKNEWWWQPQSLDILTDAFLLTGDSCYLQLYEPWYDGITRFNYEQFPEDIWKNNSVDDLEWIAITLIRMYEATGDVKYILQAQRLYDTYIITTWGPDDEEPWRGGLSWSTDSLNVPKTKNACSNGPGGIIASMLAAHHDVLARYGSRRSRHDYEQDLLKIFQWERDNLFEEVTGAVYDHLSKSSIARRVFSYNSGTFLAMAMRCFAITHEQRYLDDAMKAADYAIAHLTDPSTGLMNNVAYGRKGGDVGLFHGIFFRYFAQLIVSGYLPAEKRAQYAEFLSANTQLAIASLDPDVMLFSRNWKTITIHAGDVAALTPHVTGCALLAAQLQVERALAAEKCCEQAHKEKHKRQVKRRKRLAKSAF